MARPVRIHKANALYLVHLRAREDVTLFQSDEDRNVFLESMSESAISNGVGVYGFALMESSALLLLRSGTISLSQFVHRMQSGWRNRMRTREGGSTESLIRDRHRSILIEEDYFFDILQRVHIAPVIGGHWSNESESRRWGEVSTNRWTSFSIFTGALDSPEGFLKEEVLERFKEMDSNRPGDAFYMHIIQGVKQNGKADILDNVKAMSLLGSPEFIKEHYEQAKGRRNQRDNKKRDVAALADKNFRLLRRIVAREFETTAKNLTKARGRHPGRKYLVELAMRYAIDESGVKGLAERLSVSGSALAHLRRSFLKQIENDSEVSNLLKKLENEFLNLSQ